MKPEDLPREIEARSQDIRDMVETYRAVKGDNFAKMVLMSVDLGHTTTILARLSGMAMAAGVPKDLLDDMRQMYLHLVSRVGAGLGDILTPNEEDYHAALNAADQMCKKATVRVTLDDDPAPR